MGDRNFLNHLKYSLLKSGNQERTP